MVVRADLQQTSWAGGEWAELVQGRYDVDQRRTAARKLVNMLVTKQGPTTRRPGTRYIGLVPDGQTGRLIPFDVSRRRSYVLVLLPGKMRVYTERGLVLRDDETVYEVSTPWQHDDIACLRYARAGDRMWLVCPNVQPQQLARHGDADWRLGAVVPKFDTADSIILSARQGWPAVVAFHQNRLCLARTRLHSQTIWMSQSGLYDDFRQIKVPNVVSGVREPSDDSRLIIALSGADGDAIEWMSTSQRGLLIGTGSSEWIITGESSVTISAKSVLARPATSRGSNGVDPIKIDFEVLYVDRTGRVLRAMSYDFERDGMRSEDISVLARHAIRPGVEEIAWQREPDSVVWCRLADGNLASCTFDRAQGVIAWGRHTIGGDGFVESMAVIPAPDGLYDVWLVVRRTTEGGVRRYIELLPGAPFDAELSVDAYVDSALFCQCDPAGEILVGLAHLNGWKAKMVVDGAFVPDRTVQGGRVVLSRIAHSATIGLAYLSIVETLPIGAANLGAWGGKPTRYHELVVDVYRTAEGVLVGPPGGPFDGLALRTVDSPMDTAPGLITATVRVPLAGAIEPLPTIQIRTDVAGPMTIRAITAKLQTYER